jgi:hypothetical protein
MKSTHNLTFVVHEVFTNLKYIKIQESFAKYKWAIMCMTYEQKCGL